MANTLSATATWGFTGNYGLTPELEAVNSQLSYINTTTSYSFGTGNNQANALFSDKRTLSATSENFDLDAGTIVDKFGLGLVFTKIKLLFIKSYAGESQGGERLTISGDFMTVPLGGTTPTVKIAPLSFLLLESPISGFAVTAGTADVITVTNTLTYDYDIIILGTV
jgi:hypothetical protein